MGSSLELSPSASSLRGVLYESPSRALTFDLFVARLKLLPRGLSRPAAGGLLRAWLSGFSPRTPSRPSWRALSSSHLRPLRCEAEASAAGTLAPRSWRAPPSLAWQLLAADTFASLMLLPRGPARSAFRGHPQHYGSTVQQPLRLRRLGGEGRLLPELGRGDKLSPPGLSQGGGSLGQDRKRQRHRGPDRPRVARDTLVVPPALWRLGRPRRRAHGPPGAP
jgi:hypothetical protein